MVKTKEEKGYGGKPLGATKIYFCILAPALLSRAIFIYMSSDLFKACYKKRSHEAMSLLATASPADVNLSDFNV